ncbi:MAG: bifunctional aconitate hydratase 2/2-methylisocitrate dehydratase [Bacteroidales bacterium]|nr:MAG: bifunctional aconitate hydratase 2/2-methylisocitrate dehydratase [Bacteroidales bacterium]
MLKNYFEHVEERKKLNIPPLALDAKQAEQLCELIKNSSDGNEELLLNLLCNRISPGVDPAAMVKAEFLDKVATGKVKTKLISPSKAIEILGTMVGGYNVTPLVKALEISELSKDAAKALSNITLVYDSFDQVLELSKCNSSALKVLESWSKAEWFTAKPTLEEIIKVKVYKVEGEINTDDFSPASDAVTRPDIPLHALSMGKTKFPDGISTIAKWRSEGHKVAFIGDVVGTGSSRKSACNSVIWHIGEDIPFIPNKRRGGIVIGGKIAPIFFNTMQDSGGVPINADVTKINMGDIIAINTKEGTIKNESGEVISKFVLNPNTLLDEYRAGGRISKIIGRALTLKAIKALNVDEKEIFVEPINPAIKRGQGFTLAQKMVGRACGLEGVLPGTACDPIMSTVGSQDTTGPMTADELTELACLKFQSSMFMQSFCHTAAYPKATDIKMHKNLPTFVKARDGVALKPGDGVIHSWLNRLLVPDKVGTGGDSHTRFPLGISFPAGSGLVAFAGALGFMPLDMPESVLIRFKGQLRPGITLRDVVNAIPFFAIKRGKLTVPKKNKVNIFNGRIIEMEGLPDITPEQAFELTDATAERSATATCIKLSDKSVIEYVKSNVALIQDLINKGYESKSALKRRLDELNEWLANPKLLSADTNAEYAEVFEIDLSEITEPIVCCPNDPDDVKLLSEVAGTKIDNVFIGSCMTNIGHFRAAASVWDGAKFNNNVRTYIATPTRMDYKKLLEEAMFAKFGKVGASIETPGCSLCMGNQLRVADKTVIFSTSTRNFDDRMGDGTQAYLGSAELAAMISLTGKIPTPAEYFEIFSRKVESNKDKIYSYLQFDKMQTI